MILSNLNEGYHLNSSQNTFVVIANVITNFVPGQGQNDAH